MAIQEHKARRLGEDKELRFLFDILYFAVQDRELLKSIYAYANDNHLNTALRQICKELNI